MKGKEGDGGGGRDEGLSYCCCCWKDNRIN